MLVAICRKELSLQLRSHALRILAPLCLVLAAVAAAVHWHQQQAFAVTQAQWQGVNDALWQNQPERHPHRVAHYGTLVFRAASPLAFIDAGVDSYLGNVQFLEAHRQNSASLRQFSFSAGELQLGYFSLATIVLVVWPLVLIAVGYKCVSEEREHGNWRLLQSLGASPRTLLAGKWLSLALISGVFLLLLFGVAALFVVFARSEPGANAADHWLRLAALFALYTGYSLLWVTVVAAVSRLARDSGRALVGLLGIWLFAVVIVPKTSASAMAAWLPHDARAVFDIKLERAVAAIGDSHNLDDPYFAQFKRETLARFNVGTVEELPVNWRGLVMRESERISAEVFAAHEAALRDRYAEQHRAYRWAALLSPYLVASEVSARLAGTDAASFHRFTEQAEQYRYALIQRLNDLHIHEVRLEGDREQRLATNFWQEQPRFRFQPEPLASALADTVSGWLILGTWLLLVAAALFGRRQLG